ncbi:glutaredoxin protein [Rhizobium phage RHph_I4]|nr:glutaredoxin protein [Rhizobium phage RHph_I4]
MKALIYSKQMCNYCTKAKALLEERGVGYELVDCTFSTELTKEMMNRSGRDTFPQVFLDGVHIGGFDDLSALDKAGGLIPA